MKKEVLASSANKLLMLLSNHLTALKNHLLKVQLKTLYLLSLQKITRIFNLSAITHSNNISELILTLELRACARASCRYDGENGTRSLARLVDSCKLFFDFRLLSAFDSFWRAIHKRNGDICC